MRHGHRGNPDRTFGQEVNKRETREKLIDAGLLSLAKEMEERGATLVLHEIFGEDIDISLQVFASMMNRRQLWDAHLHGTSSRVPPPTADLSEFIYIPTRPYPNVSTRPVRWGTVTKMHHSKTEFKLDGKQETFCGLRIPQLAVVLPSAMWHPGSDEACRLCVSLKGDA